MTYFYKKNILIILIYRLDGGLLVFTDILVRERERQTEIDAVSESDLFYIKLSYTLGHHCGVGGRPLTKWFKAVAIGLQHLSLPRFKSHESRYWCEKIFYSLGKGWWLSPITPVPPLPPKWKPNASHHKTCRPCCSWLLL